MNKSRIRTDDYIGGIKLKEELDNIPLADADPQAILPEHLERVRQIAEEYGLVMPPEDNTRRLRSESASSSTSSNDVVDRSGEERNDCNVDEDDDDDEEDDDDQDDYDEINNVEEFLEQDNAQEKAHLITKILEMQNTLDELANRVDCVQEENMKLRTESQILEQYMKNMMHASSVFQSAGARNRRKIRK